MTRKKPEKWVIEHYGDRGNFKEVCEVREVKDYCPKCQRVVKHPRGAGYCDGKYCLAELTEIYVPKNEVKQK